jgi:protein-tyrosine phosphatase
MCYVNKMSKILDNLYLGSYDDIKKNIHIAVESKLVINVSKECKYETEIEQLKLEYADNPNVNILENVNNICDKIHQHISNNETVFIHCWMGKSRSATLVLAYLITHQNFSLKEALDHVKSIRNINPNIGFMRQLIQYELQLKNKASITKNESDIEYISELLELDNTFVKNVYEKNNYNPDKTIDYLFQNK